MDDAIPQILVSLAFGGVCAAIAHSRGRSALGWFFIGFLISCIGIIILLVLPDLNEEESRRRRIHKENRRLRERLKKDRGVSDSRYAEVHRRLGVHDQVLALDTAPTQDAPPELLPGGESADSVPAAAGERWWWVEDGDRQGPVPFEEMKRLWLDGVLDHDTLVWRSGMADWTPLEDADDLAERLGE